jgi:hypothetical protein
LLTLMLVAFFPTTFVPFGGGAGVEAALHFPAHILEALSPELPAAALAEPTSRARAETRITEIGISPSKPGMCDSKLSRLARRHRSVKF